MKSVKSVKEGRVGRDFAYSLRAASSELLMGGVGVVICEWKWIENSSGRFNKGKIFFFRKSIPPNVRQKRL